MKTIAVCMQCQIENGRTSYETFIAEYFDDGVAHFECSAGHKTALVMQRQKFEMLMDSGAAALLEGFTLEACASFAAALERFYEFSLRVVFAGRALPTGLYLGMFAEMARQSERQMGAFMLLHATEFGSAYKPKPRIAEFRNAVIHKGAIPTVEEAHEFCSDVYSTIYNLFNTLDKKYKKSIFDVVKEDMIERQRKVPNGMKVSVSAGGNLFSIPNENKASTFAEALKSFKQIRSKIRVYTVT